MRFENKVAIITAAGGGIGGATARRVAAEGGRIFAVDRDPDSLEQLMRTLPSSRAHEARSVDCLKENEVRQCVDRALQFGGGHIDILINGVGGSTLRPSQQASSVDELELEDWDELTEFNLNPTFLFCKHVLPHMKASRYGKVVNIASIAARGDGLANAAYSAAKAGIISLTKRISREVGPYGVNCNAISPGLTETPRIVRHFNSLPAEGRAQMLAKVPLGRFATADDQAAAIAFLISEDAAFITGVTLDVTGGQ